MSKRYKNSRYEQDEQELEELEAEFELSEEEKEINDTTPSSEEDGKFKQRYADLRRHLSKQEQKLSNEIEALKEKLNSKQETDVELPTSKEDVEAWIKKYPDVAKIVRHLSSEESEKVISRDRETIKELKQKSEAAELEAATLNLKRAHPDFDELRENPDFQDWVGGLSTTHWARIALTTSRDWQTASDAIDLFKLKNNISSEKPKRKDNSDAATSVKAKSNTSISTGKKNTYSESMVNSMSDSEYARHEKAIDKAIEDGTFLYDLR